jgi:hypothetical protein
MGLWSMHTERNVSRAVTCITDYSRNLFVERLSLRAELLPLPNKLTGGELGKRVVRPEGQDPSPLRVRRPRSSSMLTSIRRQGKV